MVGVQKEIAEEQNMKDANTLKRKALENPTLFSAPSENKKVKKEDTEQQHDSDHDEFFDAANEFENVTMESAGSDIKREKPVGPIDTGYRKVSFCTHKTNVLWSVLKLVA